MSKPERDPQSNPAARPDSLSVSVLRRLRLRAQCLAPRLPRAALVQVVKTLCGVQAQLPSAMELALRARVENLTAGEIETSRVNDRALVRTWAMRGSMHLVAADDLDWQLSAISPAVIRDAWRWFERKHGIDRERAALIIDEAQRVLKASGAMLRRDLMRVVAEKYGAKVEAAAAGVVHLNALLGRLCFGPDHGAHPTYVALDDWLGRSVPVSEPDYVGLARRYLRGYGPAEPRDLAAWWGSPLAEAKKAWASLMPELTELTVEGQPVWMLSADAPDTTNDGGQAQTVRLLPAFDTYLLGYHNRAVAVPPEYQSRIFHGGQLVPVILADGCAVGAWRYERRGKKFHINAELFAPLPPAIHDLIAEEADDIGRFYDLTPDLHLSGQ